jgi:hypothetical protein
VSLRVALLRMNEVRKFNRIADEEDGRVIADQIIVAFFRIELHGKSTRIAHRIGRA